MIGDTDRFTAPLALEREGQGVILQSEVFHLLLDKVGADLAVDGSVSLFRLPHGGKGKKTTTASSRLSAASRGPKRLIGMILSYPGRRLGRSSLPRNAGRPRAAPEVQLPSVNLWL